MLRGVYDLDFIHNALLEATYPSESKCKVFKPIVTYVGTIKYTENCEDLILVTDQFEVDWILDYCWYPTNDEADRLDFSGLFVMIRDGDYEEVFAFEG
jgi:hypothetical protein